MGFDPDQYLAKNDAAAPGRASGGGFDPDKYLAKTAPAPYADNSNPIRSAALTVGRAGLSGLNTVARTVDRFTGAPMRSAISAAQNSDNPMDIPADAIKAGWKQFGADPDQAPSGEDIVKRAGVPDGMASKAAGFGMDMAANPLNFTAGLPSKALGAAGEAVSGATKWAVPRVSELMTGAPKEAFSRLIERPAQVMGAEREGNALNVARNAREELLAKDAAEDTAIRNARDQFRSKFGDTQVDTSPIIQGNKEFLAHNAPTEHGIGPLDPQEVEGLSQLQRKGLLTINPEVSAQRVDFIPKYGKPSTQEFSLPHERPAVETPDFSSVNPGEMQPRRVNGPLEYTDKQLAQMGEIGSKPASANLSKANASGYNPYEAPPKGSAELSSVDGAHAVPGEGFVVKPEEAYTSKSAGDLQKLGDQLGNDIKKFDQSKLPGSGDTRYQAYLRGLYGKVKAQLHALDPDGLAAADQQFSDYAQNAKRVGKLENEDQMEGFINNYYGKNKTLMRESAEKLIPSSVDDIADIGASRAFERQGPAGSEMGRRAIGGALGGVALAASGHPIPGAIVSVATSPGVHKAVIGNSSKAIDAIKSAPWFKAVQSNPQLLQSISNPSLRSVVSGLINDSGNAIPQIAKEPEKPDERKPSSQLLPEGEAQKQFLEGN